MSAAETHCVPLAQLRRADAARFGGKSASLGELLAAQVPVPPGFALAADAFTRFLEEAGLAGRVATAVAGLAPGDTERVGAVAKAIGEEMRSAPVPAAVIAEVGRRYAELGRSGEEVAVAVRSSALGEDSEEATFAGQQDSYLWVRGAHEVADAVRDCWVSLYSPQAISYRARLGATAPAAMGVTVQLMVDAALSGVMFTCNPLSGDPSMVAVNASWGLGLAVVGGEVTPDYYLLSKVTGELVRQSISAKEIEYVPGAGGRGAIRVDVDPARREQPCLEREHLDELLELARVVQRHFGSHQDVEWAIDREGRLFVLQSRPVTAVAKPASPPPPTSAIELVMGTFGAGGTAAGGA
ncbi:MAG TPA: PEP/pyruvate-binding domain-containing protein [Solirubrobacteraceae bacterium]|nr:PEP/pyruvate-binding domain-containing protein [Solirubrobacteraceae bacterium]